MEYVNKTNAYRKLSFWKGRPVLVTGGAGFLGSWLTHALLELEARPVVLDIKKTFLPLGPSLEDMLMQSIYVQGDIRDRALLEDILKTYQIETIFHLAAQAIVPEAIKNPHETLDVNVRGTHTLIDVFRNHSKGHMVVASSDKAYGSHESLPYTENHELRGIRHPYDYSKAAADSMSRMYAHVYNVPICVTRCGNIFGGGDLHFSRIVPDAIRSYYQKVPLQIRSNGKFRRDYIYVKDVVAAYLRTAEEMYQSGLKGEAFNFGHTTPLSVIDMVEAIKKHFDANAPEPVILNTAQNEIEHQYVSTEKANKILGWKPLYSLDEALAETVEWYKNHFSTQNG